MASALTTIDNPYNPISQFDEWNAFDMRKGYNSLAYLARVAKTSPDMVPVDYNQAVEDAIDEIVKYNILGIYIKYTENNAPRGG